MYRKEKKKKKKTYILSKLEGTIKVDCLSRMKLMGEENGVVSIMSRKVVQFLSNEC